jgi:hypothetical protein
MKLDRPRILPLAALGLLVPGALAARQESAAPAAAQATELPTPRSLFDRFAEVTNAREMVAKTSSMHVLGTVELSAMGLKGTLEAWAAKPDRRRMVMQLGSFGQFEQGISGDAVWQTTQMFGARLLNGTERLQFQIEADYDAVLKPADVYESTRTVGRKSFAGQDCYQVELVARALAGMDPEATARVRTFQEYYAVESGLLVGQSGIQSGELGEAPFENRITRYCDFGGYRLACETRVKAGPQEFVMTIDEVEFDTVEPTRFDAPEDVAALLEDQAEPAPDEPSGD